jgi:hypothetical protein
MLLGGSSKSKRSVRIDRFSVKVAILNLRFDVESRFVIYSDYGRFALPEDLPWSDVPHTKFVWRRAPLRLGGRYSATISSIYRDVVAALAPSSPIWTAHEKDVHVKLQIIKDDSHDNLLLLVDLWTQADEASVEDIEHCERALAEVLNRVAASLNVNFTLRMEKRQEFIEYKLPARISRKHNILQIRAAIASKIRSFLGFKDQLPTLSLIDRQLKFGPEPPGNVNAFRQFLEAEIPARTRQKETPVNRLWSFVPVAMAAVLVLTWWLPLRIWSICLVAGMLITLMSTSLWPARVVGFRSVLRRTATTASLGFFGIGAFGVAYAIRALQGDDLGVVDTLGYPFLVSAGVGIAGGILGENPKGAARIIAHIQLLLFLGGLIGIVAVLLRIDRGVRQRRE